MAQTRRRCYRKEYPEKLVEHMKKGYSFKSFGAAPVGVTETALNDWVKKYPEFREAKEQGEIECLKFWEKISINGTLGKIKNFNCSAFIFNMKNRFKWTDRTDLSVTVDDKMADREKHEQLKAIDRKQLIQLAKAG